MYELSQYLKAINETKVNLLNTTDKDWTKKYPPFIINKCLSMFWDTLPHANEMNGYHFLDKDIQFQFLLNSVRTKKRFGGKWIKKQKLHDLEVVKEYYGYSNEKARTALQVLTPENIIKIKEACNKGGRTK
jgi:hypothetical protein